MQPVLQKSDGHVARLRIFIAIVDREHRRVEVEVGNCLERQAALADVSLVLCGIEDDVHREKCTYKKIAMRGFPDVTSNLGRPLRRRRCWMPSFTYSSRRKCQTSVVVATVLLRPPRDRRCSIATVGGMP